VHNPTPIYPFQSHGGDIIESPLRYNPVLANILAVAPDISFENGYVLHTEEPFKENAMYIPNRSEIVLLGGERIA
jgi:hypothetical protein